MKDINALILKEISKRGKMTATDLVAKFDITRQAINRRIRDLILRGDVLKLGSSKKTTYYIPNTKASKRKVFGASRAYHKRVKAKGLREDSILFELESQTGLMDSRSKAARTIFGFALTEMVNNAIDHSGTRYIDIDVAVNKEKATFSVADTGVGAFENVREKKKLKGELDAIQDILKGKMTTAPAEHSGEGIFFTSKAADKFVIESHQKRLTIDNNVDDVFVEDMRFKKGTRVCFEIGVNSRRELAAIFRQFTNEEFRFDKTSVTVKLYETGEAYVSRSQAKRLLHSLENFREICLDFAKVATVGQGFADEIFRVFKNAHPDIQITAVNAGENVTFMIKRALP